MLGPGWTGVPHLPPTSPAAARTRADSLEDLDSDADEPGLFYPDLYPGDDELDGWAQSPNQWPDGGALVLSPEEVDETGEVYDVLDTALGELPEPLGQLLTFVDLQGHTLHDSGQALGLDNLSVTAALARARNHIRGRLSEYLTGTEAVAHPATFELTSPMPRRRLPAPSSPPQPRAQDLGTPDADRRRGLTNR